MREVPNTTLLNLTSKKKLTLRPPIDPKTTRLNLTSKIKVPSSRLVGGGGRGLRMMVVVVVVVVVMVGG